MTKETTDDGSTNIIVLACLNDNIAGDTFVVIPVENFAGVVMSLMKNGVPNKASINQLDGQVATLVKNNADLVTNVE